MMQKKSSFIGLEFASSFVRVVHGTVAGTPDDLVVHDAFETKGLSEEEIAVRIKEALVKSSGDTVIVFVPRRNVIVRFLDLPSREEDEIRNMVTLQLDRHLPYAADEMYYDISVSPSTREGYSHVVLAAMSKGEVNRILSICSSCGVTPDLLTLSSVGTFSAFINAVAQPSQVSGIALIIDSDFDETEFILTDGCVLVLTRSISHAPGFHESGQAEDFLDRIFSELQTTIDMARSKYGFEKISSIQLGPALEQYAERFRKRFPSVSDVKTCDAVRKAADALGSMPPDHSIFSVLGMPYILGVRTINFLPRDVQRESLRRASSPERRLSVVLFCCVVAFLAAGIWAQFYARSSYVNTIEAKLTDLDPEAKKISRTVKKIKIIDQIKQGQILPLEIIKELYAVVPRKMFITILEYDVTTGITVRGFAPELGDVSDFLLILQKSDYFNNAEIKFAKHKQIKGNEGVDFEIVCPYFSVQE